MGNSSHVGYDSDEDDYNTRTNTFPISTYNNPECCSTDKCECPICMENKQLKKLIPCNHHICENCIQQLIDNGDNRCPNCRTAFTAYGCNDEYIPIEPDMVVTEDNIIDLIRENVESADGNLAQAYEEYVTPFVLHNPDNIINESIAYFERSLDRTQPHADFYEEFYNASNISQALYEHVYLPMLNGNREEAINNSEQLTPIFLMNQYRFMINEDDADNDDKRESIKMVTNLFFDISKWLETILNLPNIEGGKRRRKNRRTKRRRRKGRKSRKKLN